MKHSLIILIIVLFSFQFSFANNDKKDEGDELLTERSIYYEMKVESVGLPIEALNSAQEDKKLLEKIFTKLQKFFNSPVCVNEENK